MSFKYTWLRRDGYTSTLTVPATPDGALAEKVKQNLNKGRQPNGTKIKVLEDGGTSSRSGIVQSNQFPRQDCCRKDCLLCFQGDGKKDVTCDLSNVGYEAKCSRCPTKFAYIECKNVRQDWE